MGVLSYGLGLNKQVCSKNHCFDSKISLYALIFCIQVEGELCKMFYFLEKIICCLKSRENCFCTWLYLKTAIGNFLFDLKLHSFKIITFWKGLRFLKYGFFAIVKYVKTPKTVKKKKSQISLRGFYNFYIKYTLMFDVCANFEVLN